MQINILAQQEHSRQRLILQLLPLVPSVQLASGEQQGLHLPPLIVQRTFTALQERRPQYLETEARRL